MEGKIAAISRHRIGIDGEGVTTLVAFMLCPLSCRYCLNPQTLSISNPYKTYTPQSLFEELRIDDLYFKATGGGVTFGGGEPLLSAEFIKEFRTICDKEWKITLETSLNVPKDILESVIDIIDGFIIDIKDMNPDIYKSYTGKDNSRVKENLYLLVSKGYANKCIVRVPIIPEYNSCDDVQRSIEELTRIGFTKFDKFTYTIR